MMLFIFLSLVVVYTRVGPKTNLGLYTKGGLQHCDAVRPYTLTNFLLSLPPGWKALTNQRLTFVSYFDQVASPIPVPLKPGPAPRAHSPKHCGQGVDSSVWRSFVNSAGPGLFGVGDCGEHTELARLQSGALAATASETAPKKGESAEVEDVSAGVCQ